MTGESSKSEPSAGGDLSAAAAAVAYFRDLQARICKAFEHFEPTQRFEERNWTRPEGHRLQGGGWSRVNKQHLEELYAAGRMLPAGIAADDRARADGSWTRLDEVETLREPDDLRAALDAVPAARGAWDGFPRSARRAILEWISSAKREPTRARRVAETVSEAAAGRRANQPRQPRGR